jgi:hypothetical protein
MATEAEQIEALVKALANADKLVTLVIRGEAGTSRAALDVARDIHELKRKFNIKFPEK